MKQFESSKQVDELINKCDEVREQYFTKQQKIEELNINQLMHLSKLNEELSQLVNEYALYPSENIKQKITKLEEEVSLLNTKVVNTFEHQSVAFQRSALEILEINNLTETLLQRECK